MGYRSFLATVFVLCWVASAGAMVSSETAQLYYGPSEYVSVLGETLAIPEVELDGEALALEMDGIEDYDWMNYGVFFEFDELTPELTDATVALNGGATISAIVAEEGQEFTLIGVGINDFIESYVTLYAGSSIVVEAQGSEVKSYGVSLDEIRGIDTAAVLLDDGSTISSKATANDESAYAQSYGVALDDNVHAQVSLDGASSITAESSAVAAVAAVVGDSSSAEAGSCGVYARYSDLVDVILAGGSIVTAKASAELGVDVDEVDGYTGATATGIIAAGESVTVALSQASKVEVEAVGGDDAEAIGIAVDYQDDSPEELSVNHGEVILSGASRVIATAIATGPDSSAEATGVVIAAQGQDTAILKMTDGSTIYAEAFGGYSSEAIGAYIYNSPNVDVDLLSGSSIEAKATVTASSDSVEGLGVYGADTVNVFLDDGSFIKATGLAQVESIYVDPRALAVYSVDDFTLCLQNGSQLIATHVADGIDPYPYAYGLGVADVGGADILLTGGSAIIASSVAEGDTFYEANSWGIAASYVDDLTIRLVGSAISSAATSEGEETNDAYAYGIEVWLTDSLSLSLTEGSEIVATASTTGTGEAISYGVFLSSVTSAEINIDETSSISGMWAVVDEDWTAILNNAGTVAGRVQALTLNNASTGVLQSSFGQADTQLSDDGIHYFSSFSSSSFDDYYFNVASANLSDGTTFHIVPSDNLGLAAEGDSHVYAVLDSPTGSWNQDQLKLTSTLESSLFGVSWDDSSDIAHLNVKFTFLSPEQAGLSANATNAYRAAVADGLFTFVIDPDEWVPNVSGAFVAGMSQTIATSYFNIGNRLGALMGMNSGDDVVANNGMWFSARFTEGEQDQRDSISGFDFDTTSLSIGIDREFGDTVIGFAYTRGGTDADAADNSADFDMSDNLFSLYGSYDAGVWYSEAILSAGLGRVDGERTVGSDVYESDYDSNSYNANAEIGMKINRSGWQLNPLFALQYSVKEYDSYTETGSGGMALHVKSEDYRTFTASVGAGVQKEMQRNWGTITPEFRGRINYDIENDRIVSTANFVGGSSSFVAKGIEPAETSWDLGAAFTVASLGEQNVSFRVGYDYSGRQDFEAHSVTGKLRFEF